MLLTYILYQIGVTGNILSVFYLYDIIILVYEGVFECT
jgi:hypothetical protein